MQRVPGTTAAAVVLAALALGSAGCGGSAAVAAHPAGHAPASGRPAAVAQAGASDAEVYVPVLRRYLSTPAENSFSQAFTTVMRNIRLVSHNIQHRRERLRRVGVVFHHEHAFSLKRGSSL